MENADRIKNLPPYLFAEIDKMIARAKKEGVDVISFGIGDPDQPTPDNIINKMIEAVKDPSTHSYPSYEGMYEYRKTVADWYKNNYGRELDPDKEVVSLIGSKEGIAHLPFCYINPGDIALVPDPGYPVYKTSVLLAGGKPVQVPLVEENNFLPDLKAIDEDIARKAKLFFINYPNNPTGAIAPEEFYEELIDFADKYDIIIAHDAAYSEIGLDGYNPPSFMQFEGAKKVGIEFNSLSKPFNMTGWRVGWAVGRSDVIESLGRIKTNIDSGIFEAIQYAGIEALTGPEDNIEKMTELYSKRRDLLVEGLRELGWEVPVNKATFYIWAKVPEGYNSTEFSTHVFEKTGIFFTPGNGYGEFGEGYVRIALTVTEERIKEALERLKNSDIKFK
ncbi:LL-diaminopimelate aminotransferase [Halothermothrix orenii]|uniref:LL-diaminopimelate aminotransferase n=1 Tax=Halothermothrix orenii (strain H 168 / OCM 544 / DSM 9562) TaxID=373903 RepID=DAPAT_HALOH|nr:LL-diaminopimelate aminotransferase [Halothermothrix orenii]B8CX89.1 RecName: Full=LL-diaminopimelate aminotransferase; Short=DAP-AT; Short=DAP-aminotransferase; Short=LL-DAP-aminotransferase [Halothermothrix orenii H 168]ACL69908.1 Aspartate transaminase;L-aspartate aminotransferase [Halothermothrix orenii H 168]